MKKTLQLSFLVILLSLLAIDSQKVAAQSYYQDVTDKTAGAEAFAYLIQQGVLTADPATPFGPNDVATRYDAIHIIVKALALPTENIESPTFTDVKADDPRLPIIAASVNAKLIAGNDKGELQLDKPLTRAEIAAIIGNAFNLSAGQSKVFFDVPQKHWAKQSIDLLVSNGITAGSSDYAFLPNAKLTKSNLVVFVARALNPAYRVTYKGLDNSCAKQTTTKQHRVNVAVTNLWNQHNQARSIDAPSLTNPVNYPKWIRSMSLQHKKWLVGKTDTQSLYYDRVSIINERGNMYRVAAHDQYVPYNETGYPGWVPKSHIYTSYIDTSNCEIAVVTAKKTTMYNIVDRTAHLEISYSTILPVLHKENGWLYVQAANDEVKVIKAADTKTYATYDAIPHPTASDIVTEAKRYLNLPYLWAGTSSWGYDCSGILYAVYREHGIMIPRDSFYQATKGKKVAKKDLQPGDLVFFAYNGGTGKVYHVGLYIGNGQMLHAPHYASKVKIEPLNNGVYGRNYAGARRYL